MSSSVLNCFKAQTWCLEKCQSGNISLQLLHRESNMRKMCVKKEAASAPEWWHSPVKEWTRTTDWKISSPEAPKYKAIFAQQANNVLQLSQAGWLMSKKDSKCHLQKGQRHLSVTSKSLCAPSATAQGTSVLQPQVLGLVHALLVHPWNSAALLKKEHSERCFWEHFCCWKVAKIPCTAILMAWGWRAHLVCIPTRITPFWKCSAISSGGREKCRFACPLTDLFECEREQGGVSGLSTLLMQEQHQLSQHRSIALTSSAPTQTHQPWQGQGGRWHSGKRGSQCCWESKEEEIFL